MKLFKHGDRTFAITIILVWVIGLVISPVSAMAAFFPSGDSSGAGIPGNGAYHPTFNSTRQTAHLQTVLSNLSQKGVDVSQAQADLAAGNMTAAFQWLTAYHKDHPDLALNGPRQHTMNATVQAADLQSLITTLGQKGVEVSRALSDLAAGNTTGAMKDLMARNRGHPGMMANSTQQAARLQAGVTKLAQQGVDVGEVQADLASGNVDAAMQWMAAYHTAHPVQYGNGTAMHSSDSTQWQKGGPFRPHTSGSSNQTAARHRFPGRVQAT
jgi:hypothetical protein